MDAPGQEGERGLLGISPKPAQFALESKSALFGVYQGGLPTQRGLAWKCRQPRSIPPRSRRRGIPGLSLQRAKMASMRRSYALVVIGLLLAACGASTAAPSSVGSPKTLSYPPVPVGGTDCGINNEMSGWPTTTVPAPTVYSCLLNTLSSGRPARFIVIRPSSLDSGRTTSDGYSIPAAIAITYRVLGPKRLQVTTDRREAGGQVTTQNCTGMSTLASGSPPAPSDCQ
jgi:hypothetical protein